LAIVHGDLVKLWKTAQTRGAQCVAMLDNRHHPVLAGLSLLDRDFDKIER
jgi:hypothetical protein